MIWDAKNLWCNFISFVYKVREIIYWIQINAYCVIKIINGIEEENNFMGH